MDPIMGTVILVANSYIPKGWAACDGSLLAVSQYSALFSLLGTAYGGNGVTTFALPDLRGRVPVGTGDGPGLAPMVRGERAGFEAVTLTPANLPSHTHPATLSNATATSHASAAGGTTADPSGAVNANAAETERSLFNSFAPAATGLPSMAPSTVQGTVTVGVTGANVPLTVRNPYLGMTYIIALVGIYPSRN